MKPEYQVNTTIYKPLALYFIAIKVVSSNLLMILVIGTDWIETWKDANSTNIPGTLMTKIVYFPIL